MAADLFAHEGYDNVSVHEIAEAVGIKESSLYNHFESKAEILSTILYISEITPASQDLPNQRRVKCSL